MASPFIFVPEQEASSSYAAYYNPYYATPQGGPTPFLPPATLYPASPYVGASDHPGSSSSPNPFNPNSVLWPTDTSQYDSGYSAGWTPLASRPRPSSWQGPAPAPANSPFIPSKTPAFLSAQSAYPAFVPGHRKTKSWGNSTAAAQVPAWANNYPSPYELVDAAQIHPWLNGDAPAPNFHFDLASNAFLPLRLVSVNPPQSAVVSAHDLASPAFHPPRTALRILHPRLPFWPIDLVLPQNAPSAPPMTLGDVLFVLHRTLHRRVAQADWDTLSPDDAREVTRAFATRCRAAAVRSGVTPAHLRDREVAERNYGVKRVDFLCGKTIFKGLVRASGDPEGVVRLVTA